MSAGLGTLRLSPAAFWSMTPRELAAALRSSEHFRPKQHELTRSDLDALMARYPDT